MVEKPRASVHARYSIYSVGGTGEGSAIATNGDPDLALGQNNNSVVILIETRRDMHMRREWTQAMLTRDNIALIKACAASH